MTQTTYDIVVVGAGHNSLVAAAYLARCGLGVLVLEKNSIAGGGAVSRQLTLPGFVHDTHATGAAHLQTHPIVTHDELELLSKHNLKFVYPTTSFMSVFDDGDTIACHQDLDRTCDEIGRFSQKDAQSYRQMVKFMEGVLPLIGMSMARPPVSFGSFVGLLEKAPFGNELILAMMKSAYDVIAELFEHPKVRMHFLKWAGETLCGPEEKTTGVNMLFLIGGSHSRPGGAVVGGTQNLTNSLIRAIESHGGEVRVNAPVRRVLNSGGDAKAVEMADGSVIRAKKAVLASIHPHLLGESVEGLDAGLVERARRTQLSTFAEMVVHVALKGPIQWQTGALPDCLNYNLMDFRGLDDFRRAFDDLKYGLLPKPMMASVVLHTRYDSTRAPNGGHTLWLNSFVPYRLADGRDWAEAKEERADWLLSQLGRYGEGFNGANVLARAVESPRDMESHSPSFQGGDIMGLASYIYQSLGLRPTAELAQYRVPGAKGLYLTGPFMHPGGGLTGGGRAVAMRVMEDLGVKYSSVIRV